MPANPPSSSEPEPAARDEADRPTERMPAVLLPDLGAEPERPPEPVLLAPPLPPAPVVTQRRRRSRSGRNEILAGLLLGVLAALTLIVALVVSGNVPSLEGFGVAGGGTTPSAPTGEAPPTATSTPTSPAAAGDGTLSCDPQRVTAPGPGRWVFQRANYATRGGRDSFVMLLRREGDAEQAAVVSAELVSPAQVSERFGLPAPPGADAALVVVLEGPIGIGGPFGARPGYRTLEQFNVLRDDAGTVHAVLALRSNGCFALSAPDWQAGQAPASTEVVVHIENR